jgi:putative ABC transport system permease protein
MSITRFFRRHRWDVERQREMDAHLQLQIDEHVADGMTPIEARRAALRAFGNARAVREEIYDMNTLAFAEQIAGDIRYAVRVLRRSPGFALTAFLTLALGIGSATAIASVFDAVLLRPLPYARPSELVVFNPGRYALFRDATAAMPSLASSGAYTYSLATVTTGEPARVWTLAVTSSLLPALGVEPAIGRGFTAADDLPQPQPRVLLRHGFWQTHFGADPAIVGRAIVVDGRPHEVIGVLPERLEFPPPARRADGSMPLTADVWTGVGWLSDLHERGGFSAIGRLAPGATPARAAGELLAAARTAGLDTRDASRFPVRPVEDVVFEPLRPAMIAFTAGVALLLLIACANLGSLLLARLTARRRELAVRASLGATASRIARQVLVESAVLAGAGAAAGTAVAWLLLRALLALAPPDLARVHDIALDGRVLAVTLSLGVLTALLVGALPAWRVRARDPRADLGDGRGGIDPRTRRLHAALVTAEVALAVVLLVGGGLLLRSFAALSRVDPGFASAGLVTADLLIPPDRYRTRDDVLQFFDRVESRLRAQPGVIDVSAIDRLPYGPSFSQLRLRIAGRAPAPGADPLAFNAAARPGYFRTMGIPIVEGREFTAADRTGAAPVVVISRTAARRYWPGTTPIGARVGVFGVEREVVGVADDVRHFGPATSFDPMIYLPQAQDAATRRMMTVVARTAGRTDAMQASLRAIVRDVDPQLAVANLRAFGELQRERTAGQRFNALVIGSFAGLSLLIAAVGIYGVLSFTVAQRTRDIGILSALGAQRATIVGMILRQSLTWTGAGLLLGLAAAAAMARYLTRLLFGLEPLDPATFGGAAALFTLVSIAATYLPARRAARVDPLTALREQ